MSDPLVSICMAAYNSEDYVADAVDSALAQTWPNIEVVIVNDGSTDETPDILSAYSKYSKVKIIHQENQGHSVGMNRAYDESHGELIKFFDSDDLLSPKHVEKQVDRLNGSRSHIASAEWGRFWDDPTEATFEPSPVWQDMGPVDWLVKSLEDARPMMQCAMFLIPKEILERSGLWKEQLSLINDFEFFTRVITHSEGVQFAPGARVYYRSGLEGSLSGRSDREAIESEYRSLVRGTRPLLDRENSTRSRRAAANMLQNFIYEHYPYHAELRARMRSRVEELGGSDLEPSGPPGFEMLRPILGWKAARRVERFATQYGLNRSSLME
jgi:glycosyltransferase involved in cell wall biosynthesis